MIVSGLTKAANIIGVGADVVKNIFEGFKFAYITDDVETVIFDVIENDPVTHSATATTRPVENGTTVSDHIVQNPDTIQITAILSNYGTWQKNLISGYGAGILNQLAANLGEAGVALSAIASTIPREDTTKERIDQLVKLKESGNLVKYVNYAGVIYENMAIENLTYAPDGDGKSVSIQLKNVNVSSVELVELAIPQEIKKTTNKGKSGKADAKTPVRPKSWAIGLRGK